MGIESHFPSGTVRGGAILAGQMPLGSAALALREAQSPALSMVEDMLAADEARDQENPSAAQPSSKAFNPSSSGPSPCLPSSSCNSAKGSVQSSAARAALSPLDFNRELSLSPAGSTMSVASPSPGSAFGSQVGRSEKKGRSPAAPGSQLSAVVAEVTIDYSAPVSSIKSEATTTAPAFFSTHKPAPSLSPAARSDVLDTTLDGSLDLLDGSLLPSLSPEGSNGSAYKARAPNSGGRRSVARSDTGSSEYPGSSMAPTPGSVASGLSSVATTRRAAEHKDKCGSDLLTDLLLWKKPNATLCVFGSFNMAVVALSLHQQQVPLITLAAFAAALAIMYSFFFNVCKSVTSKAPIAAPIGGVAGEEGQTGGAALVEAAFMNAAQYAIAAGRFCRRVSDGTSPRETLVVLLTLWLTCFLSDTFGSASVLTLVFDAAFLLPKALSIQPGGTQEVGDLMRSRCLSRMGDNLQRRNNAAFLFGAFVLGIFLSKTFLSTRSYFFAVSVVAVAGKMQLMPASSKTRSGSKRTQ